MNPIEIDISAPQCGVLYLNLNYNWSLNNRFFICSSSYENNNIDSVWQDYGLEEEPARLTGAEKDALTKRYIEEGVFNEVKFSQNFLSD